VPVVDGDGDGFAADRDCDAADPRVHPGAADPPYDGVDSGCDGGEEWDLDGDGARPEAYGGGDCDDRDPAMHPLAPRVCGNGVDDDCDAAWDCDLRGLTEVRSVADGEYRFFPISGAGHDVDVGDVDGDGLADLLVGSAEADHSWVFRGPLQGVHDQEETVASMDGGYGTSFGDFDGDGRVDVVTSSQPIFGVAVTRVWLATGLAGPPHAQLEYGVYTGLLDPPTTGDLSGDGVDEVVVAVRDCAILNYSEVSRDCLAVLSPPFADPLREEDFVAVVREDLPVPTGNMAAHARADLTGDGLPDLALTNGASVDDGDTIYVLESPIPPGEIAPEAVGSFVDPALVPGPGGAQICQVSSGDLDGDGQADLMALFSNGSPNTGYASVLLGPIPAEGATLADAWAVADHVNAFDAVIPGDLDGALGPDLVVSTNFHQLDDEEETANYVLVYYSPEGVLSSADAVIQDNGFSVGRVLAAPGDVDGDGLADFVIGAPGLAVDAVEFGGAWVINGQPTGF
jgi:hypothetical protein